MIISVFSSLSREATYVYLPFSRDNSLDLEKLPESIAKFFIKHKFVLHMDLTKKKLVTDNNEQVMETIKEHGFYLYIIDPHNFDAKITNQLENK